MPNKKITIKAEIIEMLIDGFAASPSRNWDLENGTKEEIENGRKKNLEHISWLADQILSFLLAETKKAYQRGLDKNFADIDFKGTRNAIIKKAKSEGFKLAENRMRNTIRLEVMAEVEKEIERMLKPIKIFKGGKWVDALGYANDKIRQDEREKCETEYLKRCKKAKIITAEESYKAGQMAERKKLEKIVAERIKTHPCNCCGNPDNMADKRCPNCYYGDGFNRAMEKIDQTLKTQGKIK